MLNSNKELGNHASRKEWLGLYQPLTLGQHLRVWANRYGGSTAIVEGDKRISYRELDRRVDELAAGFAQLGIGKGDNVVIQLPNRISFVASCFALFRIGALPVLALPAHREGELDGIFSLAQPVAYIVPDTWMGFDYAAMARKLLSSHACVRNLIVDGNSAEAIRLADVIRPPMELSGPEPSDIALLLLSGGTTGTPKLIPRSHADYFYNAEAAARRAGLSEHSIYLAVLPVAHNFPLCCPGIMGIFATGGKVVMCATTSCDEAFPLIERERVTITSLVPALVKLWLEELEWNKASDLSSLEVVQVGGAMLEESLARRIMPELGCRLQQVFGMAEGLICCTALDDDDMAIWSSQGKPLSEQDEIRIVDEHGSEAAPGQFGELMVRGPYTITGYYRAPEQNRKSFTAEGYYCSGDLARWTPAGHIQIGGRIKEQINRAGEKIDPAEIESLLLQHPSVKDIVIVGLPDKRLGERSCACVITDSQEPGLLDLHRFLREKGIARYKMPDQIMFVAGWPLTSVGKVDKTKLRQMASSLQSVAAAEVDGVEMRYWETTIAFAGDVHLVAAQLIDCGLYDQYVLYENRDELSIGLGIHTMLTADSDFITLQTGSHTLRLPNLDLSEGLQQALSGVPLPDWRAYGIANFSLARYYQGLPLLNENPCLLKLCIPEAEVRFRGGEMLLRAVAREQLDMLKQIVESLLNGRLAQQLACRLDRAGAACPEAATSGAEAYLGKVGQAVEDIRQRRYQKVILSRRIPLNRELDMVASYVAGRRANNPARSYLLNLGGLQAAGFSPETVVEVDAHGWISTLPLAGTRSAGSSKYEENRLRTELINDPKEIAEHAVSVKLAFEELEQVCDSGTIVVSDFMSVMNRGTVQHLGSRLRGKLKDGCSAWHALRVLFPAVTASGIPKREAIEAIGLIEDQPRNLYSGSVLTVDSSGALDAALVLRTIFQQDGAAWLQAGAGVVGMSLPARELEETREKLSSFSARLVASSAEQETARQ
ncbi:salicylate synthase [Paenibacillus sp. HN-1]|uniref:salicylate synthase n=1 Tax=Paenibacillus TaxID=44249 RepID=UPI001CA8F4D6|nr:MULTISPECIES: salicylate synthase [Paenibacillus]MBY9080397.1 salicylate synthase [Paenibacillus sp. CGMCC 1.18879]MBY9083977.1 salicylate synthase [Paenibacillus sinensis]